MTVQDLARLIATYKWLSQELDAQSGARAEVNRQHIRPELDNVFLKIVQYPTDNPQICCAQIEFVLSSLAETGRDDGTRAQLCALALAHVQRLSQRLGDGSLPPTRKLSRGGAGPSPLRTGSA